MNSSQAPNKSINPRHDPAVFVDLPGKAPEIAPKAQILTVAIVASELSATPEPTELALGVVTAIRLRVWHHHVEA